MKRVISLLVLSIMLLSGCNKISTTKTVENFFDKYNSLNEEVIDDLETNAKEEHLSTENTKLYVEAIKRQYEDLKYEITGEELKGDEALIKVKITVYDLYKTKKETLKYLEENKSEFNVNDIYNEELFFDYQLKKMKEEKRTIEYSIDITLEKKDDVWIVKPLDKDTLLKIHGLYNYEEDK